MDIIQYIVGKMEIKLVRLNMIEMSLNQGNFQKIHIIEDQGILDDLWPCILLT